MYCFWIKKLKFDAEFLMEIHILKCPEFENPILNELVCVCMHLCVCEIEIVISTTQK